jgi:hypothetical protein
MTNMYLIIFYGIILGLSFENWKLESKIKYQRVQIMNLEDELKLCNERNVYKGLA